MFELKLTNNGRWVEIAATRIVLPVKGEMVIVEGTGLFVKVTPDLRIGVKNYELSEQMTVEQIEAVLSPFNVEFKMYSKDMGYRPVFNEKGEIDLPWKQVLLLAGLRQRETMDLRVYRTGGFVFTSALGGIFHEDTSSEPYLEKDVRKAANMLVAQANRWLHENLRSLKRAVKLTPFEAIELYKRAQNAKVQVIEVKLGDTVETKWWDSPSFGSGGGWSNWTVYGQVTKVGSDKNSRTVIFDQGPAVIYTAAGDAINDGRVFYRKLYVCK